MSTPHPGGMPRLPDQEARRVRVSTRPHPVVAAAAREIAARRGVQPSALLRELILAELEAEGYADAARRPSPNQREDADPEGMWFSPNLSEEESALADRLAARAGLTPHAWRCSLLWDLAAGEEDLGVRRPALRRKSARPGLSPEEMAARDAGIRQRRADGWTLARIAAEYGVSKARVRQILEKGEAPG